ncbi:MAG: glycosyltransferase family 2 protein [Planctomycetes bacterium]|nr:glycosyltransferase family 2 protein [Planctomycetota bacterium]MCB9826337.1 glycosyltransferase family 2 protein [Planctomycetota bacterium]MCB9830558.1 glycosyltransferase family 2 protein [Planctomycetota bacterium]MCB9901133.1 glycosyltransferase family 2 protein [Planctomycetota bacterium]
MDRSDSTSSHHAADRALVSVVVPVYNRPTLVQEAIRSVLEQTEPRFEIVVVDDGSTDGTADVVEAHFGHDPRLRVVRQPNGGTAAARNRGIDEARAPWIAFLDDDDVWLPGYLEGQLRVAAENPDASAVLCDARFEGSWERKAPTVFSRRSWKTPDSLEAMLDGAWGLPSSLMIRTDVAQALHFSREYRVSEDTEFLFRFHIAGHRLVENPAVLSTWRKHDGAGGADTKQKTSDDTAVALDHLHILERYASYARKPKSVLRQIARRRALLHVRAGRWRSARPHLWAWWRRRPSSTRAFRYLLTSLVRGDAKTPGAADGASR